MSGATQRPMPGSLVGARVKRKHDPRLLRGGGRFLDDIELDGMVHAAVVRSAEAHGRLTGFDATRALAHPDVLDVITPEIAARDTRPLHCVWIKPDQRRTTYPVVPDVIRYVGEPLGLVVARTRAAAEDAAELIEIEVEPLEVVATPADALAEGAPLLFPEWGTNVATEFANGDVGEELEAAFAAAPHVVERTFAVPRQSGMPLEARGVVARRDPITGELTIWNTTQAPHHARDAFGESLGLPIESIRVIATDLGGGFGTKDHVYPDEVLAALAATRLDRPVKWVQDRREALLSDSQERQQQLVTRLAVDDEGNFLALHAEAIADMGGFPTNVGAGPPWVTTAMIEGQYKFPLAAARSRCVLTNKTPLGAMRGFGMPTANWALERIIDEAAREVGIDPAEIRRRNLIGEHEFPYKTRTGMTYDSGSYEQAMDQALALIADRETPDDGRRRGVGIASYVEFSGLGPTWLLEASNFNLSGYETAKMRLEVDGTLTVSSGVISMGQGIETTLAQIAADAFAMPIEKVNVHLGDTNSTPYSSAGSIASRSIAVGGSATLKAGEALRKKVLEYAAHQLEASEDDLEIGDGAVRVRGIPSSSVSLASLADKASKGWNLPPGMEPKLESEEIWDPAGITYGFATNAVAVAVDVETGEVELEAFAFVHDCGTVVNPMIVDGQIHGAIATGIGGTFLESLEYDEYGQPRSTTFMDYLMPSSAEIPDVLMGHSETPSPLTPGGAKGVGEGGTVSVAPAIGNALANAVPEIAPLVTHLPLSPSRVWGMLRQAGVAAGGAGNGAEQR